MTLRLFVFVLLFLADKNAPSCRVQKNILECAIRWKLKIKKIGCIHMSQYMHWFLMYIILTIFILSIVRFCLVSQVLRCEIFANPIRTFSFTYSVASVQSLHGFPSLFGIVLVPYIGLCTSIDINISHSCFGCLSCLRFIMFSPYRLRLHSVMLMWVHYASVLVMASIEKIWYRYYRYLAAKYQFFSCFFLM